MRRKKLWFALSVGLTAHFAFCALAGAESKVVHIYNWSDYIDEDLIKKFETETGIQVDYQIFDSNALLETKLLAGHSGYDVVVPSSNFLARQIRAGAYSPLDKALLTNRGNLWDFVLQQTEVFDPGNRYSVNYMWGTTGIGYNKAAARARLGTDQIDSWAVIFDAAIVAKFKDCGVYLLDTPGAIFPAAMVYLGLDPRSKNAGDFERAARLVSEIRPFVANFNSSSYTDALATGDACLVVGWSGDVLAARDRAKEAGAGIELEYAIPKEGAEMWFDQMAIPKDAPNPEAAHRFLNFMLRPENIAAASNYVRYANGNMASQPLLDPDVLGDPAIYPPPETMKRLYVVPPNDQDTVRLVNRLWTSVKAGS